MYQIGSSSDIRSCGWHIKPYSKVEKEEAGEEDIFYSLRWQQEVKTGMMEDDSWSC